jgi:hypothetical protein
MHFSNRIDATELTAVGKSKATPTLLIAGERDKTTPPAQAIQFHHALVLNQVPTELALYPQEGHTAKARKVHRGFKGLMNEIFLDDLRERVHRGLGGQAMKRYWCGGRPYGFRLKPVVDASKLDVYGQPSRVGTVLEIDDEQAAVVQEIFARYVDGASCLAIARELTAPWHSESRFDLEAQSAAMQGVDGLGGARHSAKPAVLRPYALECLAVRARPRQRQAQTALTSEDGVG